MSVRSFPPDVHALSRVRSFVREVLDGFRSGDAELVATELATNAIRHANTPFRVALERHGDVLRIAIRNGSSIPPGVRDLLEYGIQGGLGLRLVDALSERWGYRPLEEGKEVWAEVHLHLP